MASINLIRADPTMANWRSSARYLKLYFRYLSRGRYRDAHHLALIAQSEYFDSGWYLERNLDVAKSGVDPAIHYFDHGAAEKRNPSELFDTNYYIANNVGASSNAVNPLLHFLRQGRPFERQPWQHPERAAQKAAVRHAKKLRPVSRYNADSRSRVSQARYVVYTAVTGRLRRPEATGLRFTALRLHSLQRSSPAGGRLESPATELPSSGPCAMLKVRQAAPPFIFSRIHAQHLDRRQHRHPRGYRCLS